jgi:anti-sigma regulatory factor (Ser/Thr protein kinase)
MHLRSVLAEWHMDAFTESAELIISELVTNAVQASTDESGNPVYHDGGMAVIRVRLLSDRARLLVEVWDRAPGIPVRRYPKGIEETGRGLALVDALSLTWGWRHVPDPGGKCVWAELRLAT